MRILVLLFLSLSCIVNAQENKLNLKVNVIGLGNDKVVLLRSGKAFSDTINVKNGVFEYSCKSIQEGRYVLDFVNARLYLPLILENGNLNVISSKYNIIGRYIQKYRMSGSRINDLIAEYDGLWDKLAESLPQDEHSKLYEVLHEVRNKTASSETKQMFDNFKIKYPQMSDSNWHKTKYEFIRDHATEPAVVHLLNYNRVLLPDQVKTIVERIPLEFFDNPDLEKYKKYAVALKNSSIGGIAPNFKLKDMHGKEYELKSYSGKYVLIDFWATWCGSCIKMMPHLKELHKKYHAKGFEIISVSSDTDIKRWKKMVNKIGMTWASVLDDKNNTEGKGVLDKYAIRALPTMILIDREGKVAFRGVGLNAGAPLDKKIKELFQ
ncbi:MAG: redoxin domain-containing protein [Bacteroidales bacterium]|nr:redoxin domain-containing protein [Bacteroidales bacterium]